MRAIKKPNREDLIETDQAAGSESKDQDLSSIPAVAVMSKRKPSLKYDSTSQIINRYALAATAVGALPMPGADVVAVSAIQADLVGELARAYGLRISRKQGKRVAAILAGAMTVAIGARTVFSVLKAVPFIGSVVGGSASAIASATTTYAIGRALADHFEKGGTLHDIMIENPATEAARDSSPAYDSVTGMKK